MRHRERSSIVGEREFAITHALTRDVAYGSLPKARRARLHARFGAWLELAGHGRDEYAALLAHHYSQAVRPEDVDLAWRAEDAELRRLEERAGVWLRRAAALAVGRYDIQEALALLHRAVELETSPSVRSELWQEIAHANALYFDGAAFSAAMQRAIELADDRSHDRGSATPSWPSRPSFARECGRWPRRQTSSGAGSTGRSRSPGRPARRGRRPSSPAATRTTRSARSWRARRSGSPRVSAIRVSASYSYDAQALRAFAAGDYEEAAEWSAAASRWSPTSPTRTISPTSTRAPSPQRWLEAASTTPAATRSSTGRSRASLSRITVCTGSRWTSSWTRFSGTGGPHESVAIWWRMPSGRTARHPVCETSGPSWSAPWRASISTTTMRRAAWSSRPRRTASPASGRWSIRRSSGWPWSATTSRRSRRCSASPRCAARTGSTSARWRRTWTGSRPSAPAPGWRTRRVDWSCRAHTSSRSCSAPSASCGKTRTSSSAPPASSMRPASAWHAAQTRARL